MKSEVKGIIFDYGGTLDTGGCHWGRLCWHVYRQHRVPVTEQQFREAYVHAERALGRESIIKPGDTFRQTLATKVKLQLEALNVAPDVGETLVSDLYLTAQRHTAHSREVLRRLRQRFPLVLVSNFYGNLSTVLREFQLDGLFVHVVESAAVGIRKPDARIFQLGVEALGLQPGEVVVVGDSVKNDIVPAQTLGCRTVWLQGEGWTDAVPHEVPAQHVITDIKELVTII
ncbi:MAG: HAD family hydrolase [Prevotella sp.]|nr:HAD family hydrolase [Prevotella sp.]